MIKAKISSFNTDNARQRINISPESMTILNFDMEHFCFQPIQLSTFMNRLFYNHFLDSQANLNLRFSDKEFKYKNNLRIRDPQVVKALLDDFRSEIESEINKLGKGASASILLSKRNLDILQGIDENSENYRCYKKRAVLLNAFYTNYASLPDKTRFEICQKELVKTLNDAIKKGNAIRIRENAQEKYFYPIQTSTKSIESQSYFIDPSTSYIYIIGFAEANSVKLERKRIDELTSVIRCDMTFKPSAYQRKKIFEFQEKASSLFNIEETIKVTVLLTDSGIKRLQSIHWMRPTFTIDNDNRHLYHFMCTYENALYYFQRFGADAVIISPPNLREELTHIYREALEAYVNYTE